MDDSLDYAVTVRRGAKQQFEDASPELREAVDESTKRQREAQLVNSRCFAPRFRRSLLTFVVRSALFLPRRSTSLRSLTLFTTDPAGRHCEGPVDVDQEHVQIAL